MIKHYETAITSSDQAAPALAVALAGRNEQVTLIEEHLFGGMSDIVLQIGTGAEPGSKMRPLIFRQNNFWEFPVGYPDQLEAQSKNTQ